MPDDRYNEHRRNARERQRRITAAGQDIGAISYVRDSERKARSLHSFRFFCESYFPNKFVMAWSLDHLKVIEKIERAVMRGELFAIAMPRGSGKTTLCEIAVIWAMFTGLHKYVLLIGSSEAHALNMLSNIKVELQTNRLLLQDFPEVVEPIWKLEGETRRCRGQRYYGQPTRIGWLTDEIHLPTIPGSVASGAILRVTGITGNIRGAVHTMPDGTSLRPSLVVLDDPQTDESARSPSQCASREATVAGAVLGLAGPGRAIAGLMTLTVIRPDDMADRTLSRDKHPEWQGERTKLVYAFPSNERLWAEYAKIRKDGQRHDRGTAEANAFYREHRIPMDDGARVAWPERKQPEEISAIQHAMNLRIDRGDSAFFAEYQNDPIPDVAIATMLDAETIKEKTNGRTMGVVPADVTKITAGIDVSGGVLWWMVCGWADNFSGYVLDYGAYPDQQRAYYTLADARVTMQTIHPGGFEAMIYAGLDTLTNWLMTRQFFRDDRMALRAEKCLVDANWGKSTDTVYQFCRQNVHSANLLPSHGRFYGATSVPMMASKPKPGERCGLNWRVPFSVNARGMRYALIDTNFWKTFIHARLAAPMAEPGSLSIFSGQDHQMLADHLTAEYPTAVTARGRTIDEWREHAQRDNHWLDTLVQCAVGASMQGVYLQSVSSAPKARERIKLSTLSRSRMSA